MIKPVNHKIAVTGRLRGGLGAVAAGGNGGGLVFRSAACAGVLLWRMRLCLHTAGRAVILQAGQRVAGRRS